MALYRKLEIFSYHVTGGKTNGQYDSTKALPLCPGCEAATGPGSKEQGSQPSCGTRWSQAMAAGLRVDPSSLPSVNNVRMFYICIYAIYYHSDPEAMHFQGSRRLPRALPRYHLPHKTCFDMLSDSFANFFDNHPCCCIS